MVYQKLFLTMSLANSKVVLKIIEEMYLIVVNIKSDMGAIKSSILAINGNRNFVIKNSIQCPLDINREIFTKPDDCHFYKSL